MFFEIQIGMLYLFFDITNKLHTQHYQGHNWIQVIFLEQVEGVWSSIKAECEDYVIVHEHPILIPYAM